MGSAIQYNRMKDKHEKLQEQAMALTEQRRRLEQELSEANLSKEKMVALQQQLDGAIRKEAEIKASMEEAVSDWRKQAEKSMRDADNTCKKMERMMLCINGLDSFSGAAKQDSA